MRISVHLTICFIGIFAVPTDYLDEGAFPIRVCTRREKHPLRSIEKQLDYNCNQNTKRADV
jgi:hypothetical protein